MNKNTSKLIRRIIICIYLAGLLFTGLYRFSVKDITVRFFSSEDSVDFLISGYDARRLNINELLIDKKEIEINKVKFYRVFKTICLQSIDYGDFLSFIDMDKSSSIRLESDSLYFFDQDAIKISLNENGKTLLKNQSSSFWLERIMIAEVWTIICCLGIIGCYIAEERREDNRSNHGPIAEMTRFFKDFKKYWKFIVFSARMDLNAEVANSYLNRLWWLLEPLFSMLVYVIVFGGLMGRTIQNYSTFVFSSLLMWNYFNKTINYSVKLVRSNRDILTKVYVPKFVILFSNMMLNLFKLVFSFIILIPMLFIFRVHVGWNLFWVFPAYIVMILLSFGVGMIFLHYGVYIDDLSYAVGILLQIMVFLSGTFYDVVTTLRYPLNVAVISLNPMAMLIDVMRNSLLYNSLVNLPLLIIWFVISLILCFLGIHIVYKNENTYVKVV